MNTFSLAAALIEWPTWGISSAQAPQVVSKLGGGLTNDSYLLNLEQGLYKLRLNSPQSRELGIDRQREATILSAQKHLKISPMLLYRDPQDRYSVFEFIEGRVWQREDFFSAGQRAKLVSTLAQFQSLQLPLPAFDYLAHLEHYWQRLYTIQRDRVFAEEYRQFCDHLQHYAQSVDKRVLCHHDLNPDNIVERKGNLFILDWEYAALGFPELDYVCVNRYAGIKNTHTTVSTLVDWMERLWRLVRQQEGPQ